MRAKGFTLIELLVVLAILAVIMAVVLPFIGGGGRVQLQRASNEIAAGLREARSRAIRDGKTAIFVVDGERGVFGILAGDTRLSQVPAGFHLGLLARDQDTLEPGRGIIRFFADGSSTGGVVGVVRGEGHENVAIDWLTGRVAITE